MGQGREAVTVRQAILVVLLIAAAFLGGAFVTGPGLQWVQARVLRSLGLTNDGEIAAVELESSEIGPDAAEQPKSRAVLPTGPIAPMPRLASELKSSKKDDFDRLSPPSSGKSASSQSRPSSLPSATPPRSVTKSPSRGKALVDPAVSPAAGDSFSGRSYRAAQAENLKPPELLNSLATLSPSAESLADSERSQSSRQSSGPKSAQSIGDEWAMLVSRMRTLSVSRFTIEGEPGGQVVFACLIPVGGRQAVTQRFEAAGDDVIQAAHAALRRAILWRATQLPRGNSQVPGDKNGR
jgi:hypothetical protein